jgi:aminoglycoside phosphotransferase (APT) family kinase protein
VTERSTPRFAVTRSRDGADVAAPLLAHLRLRLDAPALDFAEPPTPILGGFDTSIYAFALSNAGAPYAGALIARVFRTPGEAERARYEAVIQNAVASLGYPAPEVLLVEPQADALGAPFIIMRRMPGSVMLDALLGPRMGSMATLLGREHARLHALDAEEFRRLLGDAVDPRRLASVDDLHARYEESVATASLDGLRPALRWLQEHRPAPTAPNAICHGDFHPLNVLVTGGEVTGVVDWAWVAIAPPAFDVGATVALLAHGPVDLPRPALPLLRAVRGWIVRRYLRGYASARPLDLEEVRYFEALRLFAFLGEAGEQLQAMAGVIESDMQSPFFARHVREGVLRRLRSITGTEIALPSATV